MSYVHRIAYKASTVAAGTAIAESTSTVMDEKASTVCLSNS
jgi:hypothetical protein